MRNPDSDRVGYRNKTIFMPGKGSKSRGRGHLPVFSYRHYSDELSLEKACGSAQIALDKHPYLQSFQLIPDP
jgi:hypothetical protein